MIFYVGNIKGLLKNIKKKLKSKIFFRGPIDDCSKICS